MAPVIDLDDPAGTPLPPGVTRLRPLHVVEDPEPAGPAAAEPAAGAAARLGDGLAGLDALDTAAPPRPSRLRRFWSAAWPLLAAFVLFTLVWQIVVWSGWKPEYLLPGPKAVYTQLWHDLGSASLWDAVHT